MSKNVSNIRDLLMLILNLIDKKAHCLILEQLEKGISVRIEVSANFEDSRLFLHLL